MLTCNGRGRRTRLTVPTQSSRVEQAHNDSGRVTTI